MAVSIFGRSSKIVSERPKQIDFKSSTDNEKQEYWNKIEAWEKENSGSYFNSNWCCWMPIHRLCEMAKDKYKLKMNMSSWIYNDGKGLGTQKQCDRLADSLELLLNNENVFKEFTADNSNVIQVVLGSWDGIGKSKISSEEIAELNERYEFGSILFAPVVTKNGVLVESAHSCSLQDIKAWINFLRGCGGFKIW